MTTTIERKTSVTATIKSAEKGEARVRFATPDGKTPDRDRDVTAPTAFTEGAEVVVSPFGHRSVSDGVLPAGRAVVHEDGTGDVRFFLDTMAGRETFRTIKSLGQIVEYSYAYLVVEVGDLTPAMRAAGAQRYLKRVRILELSPVVMGAGIGTGTLDVKSCGCGAGSRCGCGTKQPSRAEREAVVAEARRILAEGAKLASSAAPPQLSPGQLHDRLTHAQWVLNCTPEVQVDRERHAAASKAAAWAAAQWGARAPRVKWFNRRDVPDADTRGFFDRREPGVIWLRSDLFSWNLLPTIMHEASHAARYARGLPQDEAEVQLDATHLVRRYVAEVVHE
jgi:hypothetical protein